jgi:hypothetical protein
MNATTPAPAPLDRKTLYFVPPVWLMLNSLMRMRCHDSPSVTVEHLIRESYEKIKHLKCTEYGRAAATA